MKALISALALSLGATLPSFAQTSFDLPRLFWPTETIAPTSQGCIDPTQPGAQPNSLQN
jgi:hypothetical protein